MKMKKLTLSILVMLTLVMTISTAAFADDITCYGTIKAVRVTKSGYLEVKTSQTNASGSYPNLCNLSSTVNSITPEACSSWLSLLTAAALSGKTVKFIDVDLTNENQCGNQSINYYPARVTLLTNN